MKDVIMNANEIKTNDNAVIALGLSCFILFVTSVLLIGLVNNYKNKLAPMEDAIAKCEALIPRNQHCTLIYYAEVAK